MILPPLLALFAWIPIGLLFFRRYPIRVAILINFIAGWALLPSASYRGMTSAFPYWVLGNSLPTEYLVTKATITGATGLLGVLLFDRKSLRGFRLAFWDLPMLMWCLVPLLSAIANPDASSEGLRGVAYQLLAWGAPYLLGRVYFSDTSSLRLAAKAFVIAGLLYVPICLIEIFTGPQFYAHVYGYQPYRWVGANRYIGYRPIGFLENGNQLGIWMATSALIAVWLWLRHTVVRILGIPTAWAAAILCTVTLMCQSAGSIVLLVALLPFVFVSRRQFPRVCAILLVLGMVSFAGLRLSNVVSLRSVVKQDETARNLVQLMRKIGRGSLGWRLIQDERHVSGALEHPILGSGQWDWWRQSDFRPWSLWLLAFGSYGMLGLVSLEALQVIPIIRVVWSPLARSDIEDQNLRHAFVAVILMSAIDNLLNSSMILPLLVVMGGMSTWESASHAVQVELQDPNQLEDGDQLDQYFPYLPPSHQITIDGESRRKIEKGDMDEPARVRIDAERRHKVRPD